MRLIDADALIELYTFKDEYMNNNYRVPLPVIRQNIIDMPTVNAVLDEYLPKEILKKIYRPSL